MTRARIRNQWIAVIMLLGLVGIGGGLYAFSKHHEIIEETSAIGAQQARLISTTLTQELTATMAAMSSISTLLKDPLPPSNKELTNHFKLLNSSLQSVANIYLLNTDGDVLLKYAPRQNAERSFPQVSKIRNTQLIVVNPGVTQQTYVVTPTGATGPGQGKFLALQLDDDFFNTALEMLDQTRSGHGIILSKNLQVLYSPADQDLTGKTFEYPDEVKEKARANNPIRLRESPYNGSVLTITELDKTTLSSELGLRILVWADPELLLIQGMKQSAGLLIGYLSLASLILIGMRNYTRSMAAREREKETSANLLKESAERFKLATRSAGIGVWEYSFSSGQIRWNSSMCHLYGMGNEARFLSKEQWTSMVLPRDRGAFEQILATAADGKETRTVQFSVKLRGVNEVRHMQSNGRVYFKADGSPDRILGVNMDVTRQREAEIALREAEDRFRSAFESAAVGMVMYGVDGRLIQLNTALCDIVGYDSAELLNMDIESFCHPQDLAVDEKSKREILDDERQSYQIEKRLIHKDGQVIWVVMSVSAVRDARKRLLYLIAQIQDITERKRNEAALIEREHFLRTLSECLPGLVSYWGRDLRCHFANRNYESWSGLPMESLRGIHMRKLLGDTYFSEDQAHVIGALRGQTQCFERRYPKSDGGWADTLVHFIPDVLYGNVEGFFALSTDITELKSQQRELETINNQLILRTDQAEAASKAKSAFLANMSHEIRTPMNAIMGLLQLVRETDLNPEQDNYLGKIASAAEVLLNVLNDVLDLSRVEANKLELDQSRFDLETMIRSTVDLFSYRAMEKGIKLQLVRSPSCPSSLIGDRLRLAQVLNNLLSNALKFTEQGSIVLDVRPVKGASELQFTITDSGIGMTQEQADKLFKPFSQVDNSSSRRYGGAGLGLSICKNLTELMGGGIHVESEPGKGSRFVFRVANLEPEYSEISRHTSNSGDHVETVTITSGGKKTPTSGPADTNTVDAGILNGKQILIADDHKLNRLVAGEMIRKSGGIVTMAENGREAIQACEKQKFDAILMDLQMPEVDGFEATAHILKELGDQAPPIIGVTASATEKDRVAVLASGMCEHLVKPFKKEDLMRILQEKMANKQAA